MWLTQDLAWLTRQARGVRCEPHRATPARRATSKRVALCGPHSIVPGRCAKHDVPSLTRQARRVRCGPHRATLATRATPAHRATLANRATLQRTPKPLLPND